MFMNRKLMSVVATSVVLAVVATGGATLMISSVLAPEPAAPAQEGIVVELPH